jgi:hypothetical protein
MRKCIMDNDIRIAEIILAFYAVITSISALARGAKCINASTISEMKRE